MILDIVSIPKWYFLYILRVVFLNRADNYVTAEQQHFLLLFFSLIYKISAYLVFSYYDLINIIYQQYKMKHFQKIIKKNSSNTKIEFCATCYLRKVESHILVLI